MNATNTTTTYLGNTINVTHVRHEDQTVSVSVRQNGPIPKAKHHWFLRFLTAWANAFTKGYSPEEWDR